MNITDKNTESGIEKRKKNLKPAWKKGDPSPNPKGKPVGQRSYATIYREAMIKLATKNNTTPEALEEEMIANGSVLARKGDFRFYKDTLDRLHGQAETKVVINTEIKEKADQAIANFLNDSRNNKK
jgi:hypothetical protein